MKITRLDVFVVKVTKRGDWVFLRLDTDAGISGIGEASQSGSDNLCVAALRQFGDLLKGKDPFRVEMLLREMLSVGGVFAGRGGRVVETAVSAVEQALWDVVGKSLKAPVHNLMGGLVRDRVRLYANINRATWDRSPEGFALSATSAVDDGFTAVKCAPFDEAHVRSMDGEGARHAWEKGLARLRAIRQAVGHGTDLLVDCHNRFNVSMSLEVAQALKELDVFWFEEPVSHEIPGALKEVRTACGLPVSSGETAFGREGFREMITTRAADIIMPDIKHVGGLMELKKVAAMAEPAGILVSPHNPAGPVATAASVQVSATLPNFLILEYAWGEVPWRKDLITPPERVQDGYIELTGAPGIGVDLNMSVVERHG
jgi:galactonate dehydratase